MLIRQRFPRQKSETIDSPKFYPARILRYTVIVPPLPEQFIENMKKRFYQAWIREVEHGTFTPLVFSATGGMSDEAYAFYKHLASLLSDKWTEQYSVVMGWLRCCLSFSLLRSAIRCVRGSCSSIGTFTQPVLMTSVELIQAETGLSFSFD